MPDEMESDQIVEKLEGQISDLEDEVGDLKAVIDDKDERIKELLEQLAEAKGLFDEMRDDCAAMLRDIERASK